MIPNVDHATEATCAALRAATAKDVAYGQAPNPERGAVTYPYAIVYLISGGAAEGDVGQPDSMASITLQVTSVGETDKQARAMGERVRQAMCQRVATGYEIDITPPAPTRVIGRFWDTSGGCQMEGVVWNSIDRFRVDLAAHA